MKQILCDFCEKEIKSGKLFDRKHTGDCIDCVLDSYKDWNDSNFHVCKKCVKSLGKEFFDKIADKYCFLEEEEFMDNVWNKKRRKMLKEIKLTLKEKAE